MSLAVTGATLLTMAPGHEAPFEGWLEVDDDGRVAAPAPSPAALPVTAGERRLGQRFFSALPICSMVLVIIGWGVAKL